MKKSHFVQQLHLLTASGIFLAILVLLYQLVARHNLRFDLTREKIHSVSPETVEVLKRMQGEEIEVRAFFAEEDPARRDFKVLLKAIATHHPNFRYDFYDPDRSPSEARRSRIESYRTTVVAYQNREERIQEFTEEAFTNALLRLAHPEKRTLCFTTGHGEVSLSDSERTGLADWKAILEAHHYEVREIQLLAEGIPEACKGVVVAGPRYELLPKELDLLQRYPEKGKGLLLLIDPMDPGEGKSFSELLRPFGVRLGEDVVVDKMSRVFGGDYLTPLLTHYADHPITKRFRVATFLSIARTVRKISEVPEGVEVTELARTTPGSWAETDLEKLEQGEAELDPERDSLGPVPLLASAELQEAPKGARLVVVGDSDFLTSAYLQVSGNKDLALNILEWLVKEDQWISIRAKTSRFEPLFLRLPQSVGVAAFAIGVLPMASLMVGSVHIWVRRRREAS